MGLIGRLLGSDQAIASGIKVVAKGLDSLIYTDQEKAGDKAAAVTQGRKMVVDWMAASQGQKLARRLIALSITGVWLFLKLLGAFLAVVAVWVNNTAQFEASSKIIGGEADSMQGAVMLILGFYFAAPYLGDIVKPAMERFNRKSK